VETKRKNNPTIKGDDSLMQNLHGIQPIKYLITVMTPDPLTRIPWVGTGAYTKWIYRLLRAGNAPLGQTLHAANGIKPFAVTPLVFEEGHATADGYQPHTPFAAFTLSTLDPAIAAAWESAVPAVPLALDPMTFHPIGMTRVPTPAWPDPSDPVTYPAFHPIALREWSDDLIGQRHARPKFPRDADWEAALIANLIHKAQAVSGLSVPPEAIHLAVSGWRARYQAPYGHPIPAFVPDGPIRLSAPAIIHAIVFTLGLGILHSAGLGGLTLESLESVGFESPATCLG